MCELPAQKLIGSLFSLRWNNSFSLHPPPDLDLSVSPSGTVQKNQGDTLEVTVETNTSGVPQVSWTKVRGMGRATGKAAILFSSDPGQQKGLTDCHTRQHLKNNHFSSRTTRS